MISEAEVAEQQGATLLDSFVEKDYPGQIDLWRIAVQIPEPPETTAGGIITPDEYRDNREFSTYVGMVRSMGPLAYEAITRSKLDLTQAIGCSIGDWVQFGKHDGEKFRTQDGTLWVILSDTQVICVVDFPEAFDCMSL